MKCPKWDANMAEFDRFCRFAIIGKYFIQFETGEVVYTRCRPGPSARLVFDDYGVHVFAQTDSGIPDMYTPDGKKVPAAWFGNTSVFMVHDFATSMVVPLHRGWTPRGERLEIPGWARNYGCYWAGEGSPPVGGKGFTIYPPYKPTTEEREYVHEFTTGHGLIVKLERCGETPPQLCNILPSVEDVRDAMAKGMSPIEFLRGYSNRVIMKLSESPIGALRRPAIEYKYLTTKGGSTC